MELLDEQPKGKQDYDSWISNGVILSKGIKIRVFPNENSCCQIMF